MEEEVEDGEVEDAVGVALGGGEVVGEDNAGEDVVEEAQGTTFGGTFLFGGHGEGGFINIDARIAPQIVYLLQL